MVFKKDPSWFSLATKMVQTPLALNSQHLLDCQQCRAFLYLSFEPSAFALSEMNKQVLRINPDLVKLSPLFQ